MWGRRTSFYSRFAGVVLSGVFVGAILFSYGLIEKVKIGGPIYTDLIAGKDVIADVLPPPLYIIESYLESGQAMLDPASAGARRARVLELVAEYDARHAHWMNLALTPELKSTLLTTSYAPARRFFSIAMDRFFPALEAGDQDAALAAYQDLSAAYTEHRKAIDEVVALASAWYTATETEAQAEIPWALSVIAGLALAILALLAAVGFFAESAIVRPLGRITEAMRRLAGGHTDVMLTDAGRTAEMRELASALNVFAVNARERDELLSEVDAGRQTAVDRKTNLERLAGDFLKSADAMKTVLDREAHVVQGCAKAFGSTVETSSVEAGQGLEASATAAESVRAVAAAVGELSASTHQVSRQSEDARRITGAASERAKAAEHEVHALTTVVDRIKGILEAIGSIAAQTNLLSLNATIEAARAGEAGRGFAVVAAEVKALAGETAKATGEVDRLLQEINACTGAVAGSIGRIVDDIAAVTDINAEIGRAIALQERASADIADSAGRASSSTDGARETSRRVSAIVAGARSEVDRVSDASQAMFAVLTDFSASVDAFLGSISEDMKERRSHVRHGTNDQALVEVTGRQVSTGVLDISLSGAALALIPGVSPGQALKVILGKDAIPGECVWVHDRAFGVRFREVLKEFPVALNRAA